MPDRSIGPISAARTQILTPSLQRGDATGDHTHLLADVLADAYAPVDLFCEYPSTSSALDREHRVRVGSEEDADPDASLTVVQYPLWFPSADHVRLVRGPRIFWYHGVTPPELWGDSQDVEILRESEFKTALAWHTHLAITDSPFTVDELHRHCGYPRERIRVVPLGIDTERFAAVVDPQVLEELRRTWQLQGRKVLLYVGRVAGHKRIDLLIDAVAALVEPHPDIKLLVVGDTEANKASRDLTARLRKQITRLGLENHVTITGRVEAVEPFMHSADLFVLPSDHEGFGVPLVEAMAAGTPVLAGESGAMPWVVCGGDEAAGAIFQPGNADGLATRISALLASPELRQTMALAGRKRATDFSRAKFAERTRRVCDEAIVLAAESTPFEKVIGQSVYPQADTRLHGYQVRSGVPIVGRLIAWIRRNSTSHVKEAYLDPILRRQVWYNQQIATELEQLRVEIYRMKKRAEGQGGKGEGEQGG